MIRKLGLAFSASILAATMFVPVASAHTTGYWHTDGYYIGTRWCTFLTSPTGNQTLLWCNDTFASTVRVAND